VPSYNTQEQPPAAILKAKRHPPIFQSVPADEFTDREEIIGRLTRMAALTPRDLTVSTAMVGRRRLGKTAVLEEVYNRLFWEQDQVVPIYYPFEAGPVLSKEFARSYVVNFLKQYVAFRRKDHALAQASLEPGEIMPLVAALGEPELQKQAERFLKSLPSDPDQYFILETAIHFPRQLMESHRMGAFMGEMAELPLFVMLDEFQEVMRIQREDGSPGGAVGLYQWAVEGRKCPHIVTGSAVRLITQEVLGTGALFGRFDFIEFPPLEEVYALELVDRLAHKHGVQIEEPLAGHLVARCGASPFYINCVIRRAALMQPRIDSEEAVDDLIAYELTQGRIWRDWSGQLQKYFEEINTHLIAKTILFYAAQFGDQHIEPELVAEEVKRPREEVYRVLQQLAFAEMIDAGGGYIFHNLKDPLLREFIKVQYQLDVAMEPFQKVYRELRRELAHWKGKYADAVGALVEARIAALMNRFDGRQVPGRLFHGEREVELPKFNVVYDTVVKGPGKRMRQADLVGSWWSDGVESLWVVEIKHWAKRVDAGIVQEFEALSQAVGQSARVPPARVVKWLVNAGGFTQGALEALKTHGIYSSGAVEINELLRMFDIERLLREG
jgi:hypothetical protein